MALTTGRRPPPIAALVGGAAVVGALATIVWLGDHVAYDLWGAPLVASGLVAVSFVLVRRTAAFSEDPLLGRVLLGALVLKMAAALLRHYVSFELYEGVADAAGYHRAGLAIQENLRDGWLSLDGNGLDGFGTETRNVGVFTGVIYTVLTPYRVVGYLGFAWLGWVGQVLFVRAFRVGFPAGDLRRYALLVMFLPSLLFWPAGIGKEGYMVLALGWVSLGVAHLIGPVPRLGRGSLHLASGLILTVQVRPHITLLVSLAVAAALLVRRPSRRSKTAVTTRVVVLMLLLPTLLITLNRLDDFFGVEKFTPSTVEGVLEEVQASSEQGGSQFEARPVRSPSDLPEAVSSVLLRPYPWQVSGGPQVVAGLETFLLLALAVVSWRRLVGLPRQLITSPYLAYSIAFTLVFIVAFSNVANTGILARQRTQILPLALVALALPRPHRPDRERDSLVDRPQDQPGQVRGFPARQP